MQTLEMKDKICSEVGNGKTDSSDDAVADKRATCPICHAVVKYPPVLSYLTYHQRCSETHAQNKLIKPNKDSLKIHHTSRTYIDAFLASPVYEQLLNVEYHGLNNQKRIRKEITETYAVLQILQKHFDLNELFVIDLCSGKSMTAVVSKLLYPRGRFLAVDKLPTTRIPHHIEEYWSCDVMGKKFEERVTKEIEIESKKRTVVLVGMHLCGNLAERAIQLFARQKAIKALLLCPCCMPGKPTGSTFLPIVDQLRQQDSADRSHNDTYRAWVDNLQSQVQSVFPPNSIIIDRHVDDDMHSDRNSILWVMRK